MVEIPAPIVDSLSSVALLSVPLSCRRRHRNWPGLGARVRAAVGSVLVLAWGTAAANGVVGTSGPESPEAVITSSFRAIVVR